MKKHFVLGCACLLCFSLAIREAQAGVRYVKVGGAGNGSSWSSAGGSIQAAINASSSGDFVFVAAGVYNLSATIELKEGVQLYGGFAGSETAATERVMKDKDGNGIVEPWEYENSTTLQGNESSRILTQLATFTNAVVVDGFTITGGKEANGGGVSLLAGSTLKGCTVVGNLATANGGGVYLDGAAMLGCRIEQNKNINNGNGGGVYAKDAKVHGCKIHNNGTMVVGVGDLLGGGVVYSVDLETGTARVVSFDESSAMAWSGAGSWCAGYNGGGQSDWTLPTVKDLQQIYIEKAKLNEALSAQGSATTFGTTSYWSSSESGATAEVVFFDNGYAGSLTKSFVETKVRAIRQVSF